MRFVLLHYHILKNAGSTIEEILHRNFREKLCRFDTPDRDGELKNAELIAYLEANPGITAFSSHQIYYPVPQAPGFLFFDLCFLRDPLDRIRSVYDYFRQKPSDGDPMSDLANQRALGEFTRYLIENWPWTVNDVQVNLFANGMVNDQPRAEDFERAIERMLEVCFLGVVDRFDESLVAGQYGLRTVFPGLICAHPAVNISGEGTLDERIAKFREACEPAVFAELLRLNAMDFALLDRARSEVRRRFEMAPNLRESPATHVSAGPRLLAKLRGRIGIDPPPNPIFDAEFYLAHNPDVRDSGMNPLLHYELHGAAEGRKPHPLFEPGYYLAQCPDAQAAGMNPLEHFIKSDAKVCKNPHFLFNCAAFSNANPGGGNPLVRYLQPEPK
jgi:hypothetical protein